MKKTIAQHSERTNRHKADEEVPKGAVPHYLLDREQARSTSGCCRAAAQTHSRACTHTQNDLWGR